MKITDFILGLLVGAVNAHAGSLVCMTDPHDTRVLLAWDQTEISLQVVSPMGYEFLPQLEGPVSLNMGAFLKAQGEDLKNLGDDFTVSWKKSDCEFNEKDPWVLNCGPGTINKADIKNVGLNGAVVTERRANSKRDNWKVRLALDKGSTYFLTLSLAKEFCRIVPPDSM